MQDIVEHMDFLLELAESCDTIVEFGVRDGSGSTSAFITGVRKALYSYDVNTCQCQNISAVAEARGVEWVFLQEDDLKCSPPSCDLLFIDTDHTYTQLKAELSLHGNLSRKYLGFHDTVTFGEVGMDGKTPGLMAAIEEFICDNPHWEVIEHRLHNNGLLLLGRREGGSLHVDFTDEIES